MPSRSKNPLQNTRAGTRRLGSVRKNLLIACVSVILVACWRPDPRLTEQAMREGFFKSEATLNQLLEMQIQDAKVVRISPTFTQLKNNDRWPREDIGFSEARWNEYRALFKEANLESGLNAYDGDTGHGSVAFVITNGAGYLYDPKPPPKNQVFNSSSECGKAEPKLRGWCMVPIKKNWYLLWM